MIYREFGQTGVKLSAIGMGTNRFSPDDLKDQAGLVRAANIISEAVKKGVNYIDVGYTYSMFQAETIVKYALQRLRADQLENVYLSSKFMYGAGECYTSSDVIHKLHDSLCKMGGLKKVTFGFCWKVSSYEEYLKIIEPNGIYDGLKLCKEQGLVEHICISLHTSPKETIDILKSGLFEGCIISCNVLNMKEYRDVFEYAKKEKIGLLTMNSLGGGIIPLQEFANNEMNHGFSVAQRALATLYNETAVTTMLISAETIDQLKEDVVIFKDETIYKSVPQMERMDIDIPNLCTKCRYCAGCPQKIPIADMMYAYSNSIFENLMYGYGNNTTLDSADVKKAKASRIFNPRFCDFHAIPQKNGNPCISCGKCEKICTQKLPIQSRIQEIYDLARDCHYSHEERRNRLESRLHNGYKKVGFFPAGKYTKYVIDEYHNYFGEMPFELHVYDNDEDKWGSVVTGNYKVFAPSEIDIFLPELILVTNYNASEEIYQSLIRDEMIIRNNIKVRKLHEKEDIAWF